VAAERWIILGVAAFAGAFGALDIAEAVHGIREGQATIVALALVIAVLHAVAAYLAFGLASHDRGNDRAASLRADGSA
jgi:uncharacterized PurR-regulated membrane protein YhhQ (DUF165 family)